MNETQLLNEAENRLVKELRSREASQYELGMLSELAHRTRRSAVEHQFVRQAIKFQEEAS